MGLGVVMIEVLLSAYILNSEAVNFLTVKTFTLFLVKTKLKTRPHFIVLL